MMRNAISRHYGKVVDKFEVKHEGACLDCAIAMKRGASTRSPTLFTGHCLSLGVMIDMGDVRRSRDKERGGRLPEHEDPVTIDDVRDLLVKTVKAKVATTWEDWLHVTLNFGGVNEERGVDVFGSLKDHPGGHHHTDRDVSLRVKVELVQIGTLGDGTKVHRMYIPSPGYDNSNAGMPSTGVTTDEEKYWEKHFAQEALIRDTPENRAALLKVFYGLDKLHVALRHLLEPGKLEERLAALPANFGMSALPAPKPKKK